MHALSYIAYLGIAVMYKKKNSISMGNYLLKSLTPSLLNLIECLLPSRQLCFLVSNAAIVLTPDTCLFSTLVSFDFSHCPICPIGKW